MPSETSGESPDSDSQIIARLIEPRRAAQSPQRSTGSAMRPWNLFRLQGLAVAISDSHSAAGTTAFGPLRPGS